MVPKPPASSWPRFPWRPVASRVHRLNQTPLTPNRPRSNSLSHQRTQRRTICAVNVNSPLGDYLPPLDDGRVLLAPPEGWIHLPRSAKYVVRFKMKDAGDLPRIVVTATDWESGAPASVGENSEPSAEPNAASDPAAATDPDAARAKLSAEWETMKKVRRLLEEEREWTYGPEIFLLNQRPAIVCNREASAQGVTVKIIVGELVIGSRRYRFELQSYPEFLDDARLPLFTAMAAAQAP